MYYNPKTGFRSADKFFKLAKKKFPSIRFKGVRDFLKRQEAFQIHYEKKKDLYEFQPIRSNYFLDFVQIDLMDMKKENPEWNDDIRYILVIIDVYTRFLWAIPVKKKEGALVVGAVREWMKKLPHVPNFITSDNGTEFVNRNMSALRRDKKFVHIKPEFKGDKYLTSVVERSIRTLRNYLKRYRTGFRTKGWTHILDDVVENYNDTWHRSIKMTPVEAREGRNLRLGFDRKRKKNEFNVGDRVRLLIKRDVFDKGDKERYSKQVYEVERVEGNRVYVERIGYRAHHIRMVERIDDRPDPVLNRRERRGAGRDIIQRALRRRAERR